MATPVQMPKQGNSVEECLIVDWTVGVGDSVSEGDVICNIETDKASFEVTATASGKLLKTFFNAGELVPVLVNIAVIGEDGEDAEQFAPDGAGGSAAPVAEVGVKPESATAPVAAQASAPVAAQVLAAASGDVRVSPRARILAADKGVNASAVAGTGPHGRVTSSDVQSAADAGMHLTPLAGEVAAATGQVAGGATGIGGRVRAGDLVAPGSAPAAAGSTAAGSDAAPAEVPYIGIRKLIGDRMMQSLNNHAQLTLNASADATAIMAFRKKLKAQAEELGLPNITLSDMVCFVVAKTLTRFPELNGIFQKESGKFLKYQQVHLALAVDTARGLMVPVLRNADCLSLSGLCTHFADLAGQCKGGSIDPDLLQGGTFTISNLGALGIESFTPVLNTPQVAILGICSIQQKAVPASDGGVKWQPTMGLSLTIDHQVVDGAPAARFLKAVADGIANFELMLAD